MFLHGASLTPGRPPRNHYLFGQHKGFVTIVGEQLAQLLPGFRLFTQRFLRLKLRAWSSATRLATINTRRSKQLCSTTSNKCSFLHSRQSWMLFGRSASNMDYSHYRTRASTKCKSENYSLRMNESNKSSDRRH